MFLDNLVYPLPGGGEYGLPPSTTGELGHPTSFGPENLVYPVWVRRIWSTRLDLESFVLPPFRWWRMWSPPPDLCNPSTYLLNGPLGDI